jgi:hypothetical protein
MAMPARAGDAAKRRLPDIVARCRIVAVCVMAAP